MDRQEQQPQPSPGQMKDKLPAEPVQNPNPRANENIRYHETNDTSAGSGSQVNSEITDGEDA